MVSGLEDTDGRDVEEVMQLKTQNILKRQALQNPTDTILLLCLKIRNTQRLISNRKMHTFTQCYD